MSIAVGDVAPDFTLRDQDKNPHQLSDYRGKNVVLMFFPFAFTGICTSEVCTLQEQKATFVTDDAVLLSVSCDSSPTLKAFAEKEGIDYPLLSDFWPHGEVASSYGVFLPEVGAANRATFVIDREGVVRWAVVTALGEARDAGDYAKALAELS